MYIQTVTRPKEAVWSCVILRDSAWFPVTMLALTAYIWLNVAHIWLHCRMSRDSAWFCVISANLPFHGFGYNFLLRMIISTDMSHRNDILQFSKMIALANMLSSIKLVQPFNWLPLTCLQHGGWFWSQPGHEKYAVYPTFPLFLQVGPLSHRWWWQPWMRPDSVEIGWRI